MKYISRTTMEESLHKLMGEDYLNCCGRTEKDGYLAFYQERGLYSVEYKDSGIVCLVYAKSPFEAIDLVDEFRRRAGEQDEHKRQHKDTGNTKTA